jgi:hypothetical protein
MVTLPIPPFTVPVGITVFGPVIIIGSWTTATLTLDVSQMTSASLLIEESFDLGVSWQPMLTIGGMVGDPTATAGDVTTITALPRTSTRVKATLTNTVAFVTNGGSLAVA